MPAVAPGTKGEGFWNFIYGPPLFILDLIKYQFKSTGMFLLFVALVWVAVIWITLKLFKRR
jgi:hypothetical protein